MMVKTILFGKEMWNSKLAGSTMEYFTKEWFFSKLSEEDHERVVKEYGDDIDSVFDKLLFTLKILSRCVNLHDGIVVSSKLEENSQNLQMSFFVAICKGGIFCCS